MALNIVYFEHVACLTRQFVLNLEANIFSALGHLLNFVWQMYVKFKFVAAGGAIVLKAACVFSSTPCELAGS